MENINHHNHSSASNYMFTVHLQAIHYFGENPAGEMFFSSVSI